MKLRRSGGRRTRLSEIGEDLLLDQLLRSLPARRGVIAGAGDDVAIVAAPNAGELIVLKTDCVVERVHFQRNTSAEEVGWKAMMRPLSDYAAVSGVPEFSLVTLIVRPDTKLTWVKQVYRGLTRAARRFQVSIVGGETSSTAGPAAISVSVVGRVEKKRRVSRRGGKPGDDLFVTGRLGGSIRGKHLRFIPRIEESRWLTANFRIHAMMDLSDGLAADLPRLAIASRVGFEVDRDALPLTANATIENAIGDGEDYELLFAISSRQRKRLQTSWRKTFPKLLLTRIGCLNRQSLIRSEPDWRYPLSLKGGYVHFR
jgi:thiamine-monophosphate kinase